jgi:hypothetical protein
VRVCACAPRVRINVCRQTDGWDDGWDDGWYDGWDDGWKEEVEGKDDSR